MPDPAMAINLTGNDADAARAIARLQGQVEKLKGGLRSVKEAGDAAKSGLHIGSDILGGVTSLAVGFLSVQTAISAVTRTHETWLANMKEGSAAAQALAREVVTLASLQEGGVKAERVNAAAFLGTQFGQTDRARVFDVVQALQSAQGGDFTKGMTAAAGVFAATQVGMDLGTAQELATQGIVQGQDPNQFIRMAHVAGEKSLRDPQTIAAASRALQFFPDKGMGFAVAGVLAGAFKEETETFTKAAGIALSSQASPEFLKSLKKRRLLAAPPMDILQGLALEGIDTPEELGKLGLSEIRQVQALSTLLTNVSTVARWAKEIPLEAADPGLLAGRRAGVEAELPETALTRQIAELEGKQFLAKGIGRSAVTALEEDRELLIQGAALRRMKMEEGPLGIDLIDERGRMVTGPLAWFGRAAAHLQGPSTFIPGAKGETTPAEQWKEVIGIIREELRESTRAVIGGADAMHGAAAEMRRGPALVPAGEDR